MKKSIILLFCLLITFCLGVESAILYQAKDIEFNSNYSDWKQTNVNDAINNLYEMINSKKAIYIAENQSMPLINYSLTYSPIMSFDNLEKGTYKLTVIYYAKSGGYTTTHYLKSGDYISNEKSISSVDNPYGTVKFRPIMLDSFEFDISEETNNTTLYIKATGTGEKVSGYYTLIKLK